MSELHTPTIWPVQKPCQIAYRDPLCGYFWLRPYVDLRLKSKIWGIAVHGVVLKLTHEEDGNWYTASKMEDTLSHAKMPSTMVLDIASTYRREFDLTIELLQKLRIKAEPWRNGWYWSTEKTDSPANDTAFVMDMANARMEIIPKKMRNGYVRLVSDYIVQKPINVGYTLAYLRDGHLELANDLKPELKDQLWGLHVDKKYLCMHLTFEPQKMTISDGLSLSSSSSTELLSIELPSIASVELVGKEKDAINNALVILSAYDIKVDTIVMRDIYWLTSSPWQNNGFVTYGNRVMSAKDACFCRLFAKNKGKTPVI